MIISFRNKGTEDIARKIESKAARKMLPVELFAKARRKLLQIHSACELTDLRSPPGNRLEELDGDRKGQCSIRVNRQYRICFIWNDGQVKDVEIVDYHS